MIQFVPRLYPPRLEVTLPSPLKGSRNFTIHLLLQSCQVYSLQKYPSIPSSVKKKRCFFLIDQLRNRDVSSIYPTQSHASGKNEGLVNGETPTRGSWWWQASWVRCRYIYKFRHLICMPWFFICSIPEALKIHLPQGPHHLRWSIADMQWYCCMWLAFADLTSVKNHGKFEGAHTHTPMPLPPQEIWPY